MIQYASSRLANLTNAYSMTAFENFKGPNMNADFLFYISGGFQLTKLFTPPFPLSLFHPLSTPSYRLLSSATIPSPSRPPPPTSPLTYSFHISPSRLPICCYYGHGCNIWQIIPYWQVLVLCGFAFLVSKYFFTQNKNTAIRKKIVS